MPAVWNDERPAWSEAPYKDWLWGWETPKKQYPPLVLQIQTIWVCTNADIWSTRGQKNIVSFLSAESHPDQRCSLYCHQEPHPHMYPHYQHGFLHPGILPIKKFRGLSCASAGGQFLQAHPDPVVFSSTRLQLLLCVLLCLFRLFQWTCLPLSPLPIFLGISLLIPGAPPMLAMPSAAPLFLELCSYLNPFLTLPHPVLVWHSFLWPLWPLICHTCFYLTTSTQKVGMRWKDAVVLECRTPSNDPVLGIIGILVQCPAWGGREGSHAALSANYIKQNGPGGHFYNGKRAPLEQNGPGGCILYKKMKVWTRLLCVACIMFLL